MTEEHTAILHSDSYENPDPLALLVHFILDKFFLLQYLLYWLLHHWKSLCHELNRAFISELWKKRGKLKPYALFLKEKVLAFSRKIIQCIGAAYKPSTVSVQAPKLLYIQRIFEILS